MNLLFKSADERELPRNPILCFTHSLSTDEIEIFKSELAAKLQRNGRCWIRVSNLSLPRLLKVLDELPCKIQYISLKTKPDKNDVKFWILVTL